ncbi:MAG TPA: class I SAM-dependent methyltransferase, partial [Anaerolineaceae bacterium]|nr:class I SAM-dependent methyltransferase [Anaerolineaceae bacterium]
IYDLYTGAYKPHIVRIALALDVFTPLAAGPANAAAVARACKCDQVGIHRLLDYLTSLNVLLKQGEKFSLLPDAATFLVRGQKAYAGDLIMHFTGTTPWDGLQASISDGLPRAMDREIDFAQDAWIESYRAARIPSSLEMWAKAGVMVEESTRLRVLDIACGCAIKSLVLAQKSPGVQVTCLDQPLVLESARDLAERWGLLSQVKLMPDNLLTADLGEAQYDTCLLGQVTHYLTVQQNHDLYGRIYKALVPGGKLVLDVPMGMEQPDEDSSFLSLVLWANSGGRAYAFEEYRAWLLDAGFAAVSQLSPRLLLAQR